MDQSSAYGKVERLVVALVVHLVEQKAVESVVEMDTIVVSKTVENKVVKWVEPMVEMKAGK